MSSNITSIEDVCNLNNTCVWCNSHSIIKAGEKKEMRLNWKAANSKSHLLVRYCSRFSIGLLVVRCLSRVFDFCCVSALFLRAAYTHRV